MNGLRVVKRGNHNFIPLTCRSVMRVSEHFIYTKSPPFPHSSLAPPAPFPFNFYCWAGKRTLEYWNKSSGQLFKLNFMLYRGIFFLFTRPCRDFILPDPGLHILGSAVFFLIMLPNVYVAWKSNFVVKGSNQINFILKLV